MIAPEIIINVVEKPVEFDLTEVAFDLHEDTQKVIFTKVPAVLAKLGVFVGCECSQLDDELAYPICDAVQKDERMFSLGTARPWTIDLGDQKLSVRVVLTHARANNAKDIGATIADNDDDAELTIRGMLIGHEVKPATLETRNEVATVVLAKTETSKTTLTDLVRASFHVDTPALAGVTPEPKPIADATQQEQDSPKSEPAWSPPTPAECNRARLGLPPRDPKIEETIAWQQRSRLNYRVICDYDPYREPDQECDEDHYRGRNVVVDQS
jgi:hypothetical protein